MPGMEVDGSMVRINGLFHLPINRGTSWGYDLLISYPFTNFQRDIQVFGKNAGFLYNPPLFPPTETRQDVIFCAGETADSMSFVHNGSFLYQLLGRWERLGWEWSTSQPTGIGRGHESLAPWVLHDDKTNPTLPLGLRKRLKCAGSQESGVLCWHFCPGLFNLKVPMRSPQILEVPRNLSEFCVQIRPFVACRCLQSKVPLEPYGNLEVGICFLSEFYW